MDFLEEHLNGKNYTWQNGDKSYVVTQPDRRLFDRYNGNQILGMINFFGTTVGKLTIEDGRKIEEIIIEQLPLEMKSQMAVYNWLRAKYLVTGTNLFTH